MSNFYQQGQTVHNQIIDSTINFSDASITEAYLFELKEIHKELTQAIEGNAVIGEAAVDAEAHIKKALLQAENPKTDKAILVQHLSSAKELVNNVDGLVTSITAAITSLGRLF